MLKRARYAAAGLPRYWIVDPVARTLEPLILGADGYRTSGTLTAGGEPVSANLGVASVRLDLRALL